jgi:hypothetical protein
LREILEPAVRIREEGNQFLIRRGACLAGCSQYELGFDAMSLHLEAQRHRFTAG